MLGDVSRPDYWGHRSRDKDTGYTSNQGSRGQVRRTHTNLDHSGAVMFTVCSSSHFCYLVEVKFRNINKHMLRYNDEERWKPYLYHNHIILLTTIYGKQFTCQNINMLLLNNNSKQLCFTNTIARHVCRRAFRRDKRLSMSLLKDTDKMGQTKLPTFRNGNRWFRALVPSTDSPMFNHTATAPHDDKLIRIFCMLYSVMFSLDETIRQNNCIIKEVSQ